jgi:hypothetical protein
MEHSLTKFEELLAVSSGLAPYQELLDEYRGKPINFEDLFILVTELRMQGRKLVAFRLVEMKVREAESEILFPWMNNARYRALVALLEYLAGVTFMTYGTTPGRTVSIYPNLEK